MYTDEMYSEEQLKKLHNGPFKHAIVKWNSGEGALLCTSCNVILATGFLHEDKNHYCKACKEKQLL